MRKVIIAFVLVALLSIAFITPALADKGGQPNAQAWFGQARMEANQSGGPGVIGDLSSNNHQGNQGLMPLWGPGDGGIRGWTEEQAQTPPTPPPD
jgi:hypothetical protein